MNAVLLVARAEVLEHRRQPWMLVVLVAGYLVWFLLLTGGLVFLDIISADPVRLEQYSQQLAAMGLELAATRGSIAVSLAVYQFTNLPVFVAILAGFSVLHDRTCGAMPFLMLAPLTRRQLLVGKVAGALVLPMVMHLVFVGLGAAVLVVSGVETHHPELFGAVPGWWVAYLLTCPAAGAVLGAIGTVISALSRDARTAYQWVSFTIGLLSVGIAVGLVKTIPEGVLVQLLLTAALLLLALLVLLVGAALISRDIEPAP